MYNLIMKFKAWKKEILRDSKHEGEVTIEEEKKLIFVYQENEVNHPKSKNHF